jgi:predicted O-linked N-acetylglucosamine transferase (SPINDLY family)
VDSYDLWLNLGHRHLGLGETAEAVAAFRRALEREPGSLEALRWLGMSLARGRQMSEARQLLERYVERRPEPSSAMAMLGHLEMIDGRYARGAALMRRALEHPGSGPAEHSTLVFDLNYDPDLDHDALIAEHRLWAHRHTPQPPPPRPALIDPDPTRRLRVGLLSPDLRAHAVAFFLTPILEHLPRDQFEIIAYANVQRPDGVSERLRVLCDRWEDIWRTDDRGAARRIRADCPDILIDLAGHTADSRLALCGLRLAPLQVTYLGYPNTTGLPQIDWRLVDRWTDPPDLPWRGAERLWRLDRCFLAFDPSISPEISPPPVEKTGRITFGSFNNLAKVNHRVIALWSRVMAAVPGSRLLLKHDVSHDPEVQDRLRTSFATHGIAPEQIDFLHRTAAYHEHLEAYAEVDVALDPFPYNGTTTTCEALWMGVPVVALEGTTHAGRVGASLLRAVGLAATLARDADDYVATAVQLARTPAMLRVLRGMLRPTMAASELLDHRGHAQAVADALRGMWQQLCAGDPGGLADAAFRSRQILPSGSVGPAGGAPIEPFYSTKSISYDHGTRLE